MIDEGYLKITLNFNTEFMCFNRLYLAMRLIKKTMKLHCLLAKPLKIKHTITNFNT